MLDRRSRPRTQERARVRVRWTRAEAARRSLGSTIHCSKAVPGSSLADSSEFLRWCRMMCLPGRLQVQVWAWPAQSRVRPEQLRARTAESVPEVARVEGRLRPVAAATGEDPKGRRRAEPTPEVRVPRSYGRVSRGARSTSVGYLTIGSTSSLSVDREIEPGRVGSRPVGRLFGVVHWSRQGGEGCGCR